MGELLGAGGYGEVYHAMWKGTEVAVKMIASEVITKEMRKDFVAEVLSNPQCTIIRSYLVIAL